MNKRILMIITSAASMGAGGKPTGAWLEEIATPYYAFRDAGIDVTLASVKGGQPPIDPNSVKPAGQNDSDVERFLSDAEAQSAFRSTATASDVEVGGYDAVFVPGGHGTMWDLPENPVVSGLLSNAWAGGAVVATVCHGAAALVGAVDVSGEPLVKGRRVSAFADSEEEAAGLASTMPFLLESRIRSLGAAYEKGADWQPFAIADGRLVTGQNPASSGAAAQLVLAALKA